MILRRGKKPSCMTCLVTLKAPVMRACEAITVAQVASTTSGIKAQLGAIKKKGFLTAAGLANNKAP